MTDSLPVFRAGTRGSNLARRQTRAALARLAAPLPGLSFETVVLTTPGDRDRATDLRTSPADFFSRDLDEAISRGDLDCALHSAKDLPDPLPAGLDCFWLPWREDPRDALVLPADATALPKGPCRIGVSSHRREEYCRQRFPAAELAPIRGNIEERLAQLDRHDYGLIVMAAAALHRLGLAHRIHEYIPRDQLAVPDAQGSLALTFRRGDSRFLALRNLFLPPVILAGAGTGSAANATTATLDALRDCEVCLYDALIPDALLDALPATALRVAVGKRTGRHSVPQAEICARLVAGAKQGWRTVRLKGGDPTVFGRLAEEVDALQQEQLPFRVLPGVGALTVAAAATGILPTRRGSARGFAVMTPRRAGSAHFAPLPPTERLRLPQILYMAATVAPQLAQQALAEGFPPDTPVALIHDAGTPAQHIADGTLQDFASRPAAPADSADAAPALLVIGEPAHPRFRFRTHAPLENVRVLHCGAAAGTAAATAAIERHGGRCIPLPMIELLPSSRASEIVRTAPGYDCLLLTSPTAARLFLDACADAALDLRRLPKLMVCGEGTAHVFRTRGIQPDIAPPTNFGADGLMEALADTPLDGWKILRLRSNLASDALPRFLRARGATVADADFYANRPIRHPHLPPAEAAIFTSASTVHAFAANFGPAALAGRVACAIGAPTAAALAEHFPGRTILTAGEASLPSCALALAGHWTAPKLNQPS
ncbi:MAG: uroporphyrinogen-III synthase [Lentisphaeria bacterium]|jgi:uroporphyrinogen III methyltransferase/synthase